MYLGGMHMGQKEMVDALRALLSEMSDTEFTDAELRKLIRFVQNFEKH